MKLFSCFSAPGYHTSIITTFGVDFDAYESVVLPRLREAGCNNNILIADARMLGHSMSDTSRRPKFAGRRYSVLGAQAKGVFHPKLILQLGKSGGRLLVASANMTAAGLAGNLEVIGEVVVTEDDPQAVPVLQAALEYVTQFLAASSVPRRQIDWAKTRTRWLNNSAPTEASVELEQGGRLGFLARDGVIGIGSKFMGLVGKRTVKRLIAVSPYWDPNLRALQELRQGLFARKTAVVVQPQSALFPVQAWQKRSSTCLFDVNNVRGAAASRFAHAKVFIAETTGGDCVLYGSANCTTSALGLNGAAGDNEEACLYRELPSGEAVGLLGLETALLGTRELQSSDLPTYCPAENLPLEELGQKLPGRFEMNGDLLRWWPPAGIDLSAAEVLLFDQSGARAVGQLSRLGAQSNPLAFRFEGADAPYFAQVLGRGFESSLAIITVEQAIQVAQRGSISKRVADDLAFLDDEAAFEGLWLLELIQKLDTREQGPRKTKLASDSRTRREQDVVEDGSSQRLTYEQFIAGRKVGGTASVPSGSLLGSTHHESVRTFLNALVGARRSQFVTVEEDDPLPQVSFSLGDETADGESALEKDDRFSTDEQVAGIAETANKKRLQRQQEFVKDTQHGIAKAVERFLENLYFEADKRSLGVVDLLRLRALLMVILGSGSSKSDLLPRELDVRVSRRQVLPSKGETGWRLLVGKLLFAFFRHHSGSKGPLIAKVSLEVVEGQSLPDDVHECLATCYWAACASRVAVDERGTPFKSTEREDKVAQDLYLHTQWLLDDELNASTRTLFDGMDKRYGESLGVSAAALAREHDSLRQRSPIKPPMRGDFQGIGVAQCPQ